MILRGVMRNIRDNKSYQDLIEEHKRNKQEYINKLNRILSKAFLMPEFMPGYPMWEMKTKILEEGKTPEPMMEIRDYGYTTWCNEFAYYVLDNLGYDVSQIVKPVQYGKGGIGYTNANDMTLYARQNTRQISKSQAVHYANVGIPILVCANNPVGVGHVGIVNPQSTQEGVFISQAGAGQAFKINGKWQAEGVQNRGGYGTHLLYDSFNKWGLSPTFHILVKK